MIVLSLPLFSYNYTFLLFIILIFLLFSFENMCFPSTIVLIRCQTMATKIDRVPREAEDALRHASVSCACDDAEPPGVGDGPAVFEAGW